MLENATRICDANFGGMFRIENGAAQLVTRFHIPERLLEYLQEHGGSYGPLHPWSRLIESRRPLHIADYRNDRAYLERDAVAIAGVELGGIRTLLAVPMLKDDELIGFVTIFRQEVRPFTEKQIELVTNFAAQAVIAIENTRLLSELRESLEQQTATSEVLRVISSSPGELELVFTAMLTNAIRICGAKFGIMWLTEGDGFRTAALHNAPPAFALERRREPVIRPHAESPLGRVARTMKVVQIEDVTTGASYADRHPAMVALADFGGARTIVAVPMIKDGKLAGVISIYRQEVQPFSDKQVALLTSFAAQAVIAIENTRLLNEQRESLDRQTATADILRVIAGTPEDSKRALDTIAETASRMFDAANVNIRRLEGNVLRLVSSAGPSYTKLRDVLPDAPLEPTEPAVRAFLENRQVAVEDRHGTILSERGEIARQLRDLPIRSQAFTPLSREDKAIGVMIVTRSEVRPFQQSELDLMTGFADQAVIAIENARLLNELRQSLEQQTATAEVLQVISSSLGELQPVFQAMLQNATRICEANFGTLYLREGDGVRLVAAYNVPPAFADARGQGPIYPAAESALGQALRTKQTAHVADVAATESYLQRHPVTVQAVEVGGVRTTVSVPLLKDHELVGLIGIYRQEVRPFTDKQVALLTSFAAQAVIAIENTRLLNELQQRTEDLSKSLHDLQTAQDRLVQTQKLASLGQLTAGIAHEIKNPLNFVNNFSELSVELIDELREALGSVKGDEKILREITELANTLHENLNKIGQHGKRADSIVKNMLLHSREGSGEQRTVDINAIVEESLNLAYHGARAEKQGFNITLERSFDPEAGQAELYPQEISRALLNFISNGFYAATKRSVEVDDNGYEPQLTASTKSLGDRVEIRIRDNGTGIPPEVKEKIFNPFFTTKPAGEGTGLGLSLSHDIIVKQHGGSIDVDSAPGEFTEIRIVLPRAAIVSTKSGG